MKTKKQIANSTADALMLIKKAKEGEIIVFDEATKLNKKQLSSCIGNYIIEKYGVKK
jgi:hypothetical protein